MSPQFNVDSDVLARSPIGSVADLSTVIQSDSESIGTGGGGPESLPSQVNPEVTDAAKASSNTAAEGDDDNVGITVTSPQGTERQHEEPAEKTEEEAASTPNDAETTAATETISSEFTNSQGEIEPAHSASQQPSH